MSIHLPEKFKTHLYHIGQKYKEPTIGKVNIELQEKVRTVLGPPGRMVCVSKSDYLEGHQDKDAVYFNACIFDKKGVEIWFGDIDLSTSDHRRIQQAADLLEKEIILTPEQPFRFEGLKKSLKLAPYHKERVIHFKPTK